MYQQTQLSTAVKDQTTPTLLRWRDSDQARLDNLCAIYASPKTPVRDMKSAAAGIERARAALVETVEELARRGVEVEEVPHVDVIKNKARDPNWEEA